YQYHYVLEATLPDNKTSYIIDPTGAGLLYKGRNGSLIVYDTQEEYKTNFPGVIIKKHKLTSKLYEEAYFLGNGPYRFIERIKTNLDRHLATKICHYCGQGE